LIASSGGEFTSIVVVAGRKDVFVIVFPMDRGERIRGIKDELWKDVNVMGERKCGHG